MTPPASGAPRQRASATDGPSLGEIGRLLEAMRVDTSSRFDDIDRKLDRIDATYVRRDLYDAESRARDTQVSSYEKRIQQLEDANQWLVRLVGGTIITAVLGGLFTASRLVGG